MRGKVTKRTVDALKPRPDGAEAVLWDTEVKGFGCRVQRGGSKSYIVHYRVGTGRGAPLRKLTIGKHGAPWTPETARKEARRLLGMVEGGADPAADKIARKEAPIIAELAERFLAEHAEAKRKASTATEYRRLLDRMILPALGRRKVVDVTRHDIGKLHHGLGMHPIKRTVSWPCSRRCSISPSNGVCGQTGRTLADMSRSLVSGSGSGCYR